MEAEDIALSLHFLFTYLASSAKRYHFVLFAKSLVEEASPIPFERHLRYRLHQSSGVCSVTDFKYNSGSPFKIKSAYATGSL